MTYLVPTYFLLLTFYHNLYIHEPVRDANIDVLHYKAELIPDVSKKTISGRVTITFNVIESGKISFDRGNLIIESVGINGENVSFDIEPGKLSIKTPRSKRQPYEVDIHYHGAPTRGINFFPETELVYTVFSTSQWLVCKDQPDDKATISLTITTPSHLKVVATGELQRSTADGDKTITEWVEPKAFSTYVYGFAAGRLNEYTDSKNNTLLRYLSTSHSPAELKQIFAETKRMIKFFEERSGVPYQGQSYTQILAEGNVSQEMDCFTVMRLTYGKQVLDDSTNINLSAHELAHQWWGNSVTCANWNHFWLNEGFAVFMASAFREIRFGRDQYLKDISTYRKAYEAVAKKGVDKPLVFDNWLNPSSDDRTLVYYKGAYVLHLLREQLGEKGFWDGIKQYTTANFGKSVVSKDFQNVMESVSGQNLDAFFSKWIGLR